MFDPTPKTPAPSPTEEYASEVQAIPDDSGQSNKVKVLIIGAGMAGLSAANHLLQNDCNSFKILEARNRIGGRIVSIPMKSQEVELGANWIHGVLGNPIFELAVSNGLVSVNTVPNPHKVVASTEDGNQVPFRILHEIYEAYVCFLRRCDEYYLCQYSPPPDINSVGEHINYEIALYLSKIDDPKEKRLRQLIFNCLLKRETCITGCNDMNDIDLLELGSYTELQGGNIVLPSGYSSILEPLTRHLSDESVITKCPVTKIYWKRKKLEGGDIARDNSEDSDTENSDKTATNCDPDECEGATALPIEEPVEASGADSSDKDKTLVSVICEDGREFFADHVICTIPLGVLKSKHKSLFVPKLPSYKQESIENLMFGTVDKIFLEYERTFLNADVSEIMLLWEDDNSETSDSERSTKEYLSKNWFKKIYSFAKLSDTLLLGWVSGLEAEYMETLSQDEVAEKCTEVLAKFLKDPYVPKPKRCVFSSWKSQPFTCGSYTSIPIGATQEDIENLAVPLYRTPLEEKPLVLFAGEHTHSNFYSTVHGAYLSGRTAAQQVLEYKEPVDMVMNPDGSDLSEWIHGISLE